MSWTVGSGLRGVITKTAVAVTVIGAVAAGVPALANATPGLSGLPGTPLPLQNPDPGGPPTGPNDPRCSGAERDRPQCQGGAFSLPTGPADPECLTQPLDAVCAGGPYAPPSPASPPPGAPPTGPGDTACISQPANPICAGGPYALPTPPPASPPVAPALPPPVEAPPIAPPVEAPPPMAPIAPPAMAPIAPPVMAPIVPPPMAPIAPPPMPPTPSIGGGIGGAGAMGGMSAGMATPGSI